MYSATYSLRNESSVLTGRKPAPRYRLTAILKQGANSFFAALLGEERPVDMLTLLTILIALLHVYGLQRLLQPVERTTPAQALMMEVSMIAISAPKPSLAPPLPAPAPEIKPPLKKVKPKPVPKKTPPVVQKAPDFAPVEEVVEPQPVAQTTPAAPVNNSKATATHAEQFTEANFQANYAHNPKPHYPPKARRLGLQGKVMLRVAVSTEGLSNHVAVDRSSGHEILDESAVEAVKQWRFIPAKRGEIAVASSVIVPIVFTLRD